jgi:hypothetical protein
MSDTQEYKDKTTSDRLLPAALICFFVIVLGAASSVFFIGMLAVSP